MMKGASSGRCAVSLCAMVLTFVAVGSASAAASATEQDPAALAAARQTSIDRHVEKYGGEQISANQIAWDENGKRVAVMTFPTSAGRSTAADLSCSYRWLCMWEHAWWDRGGGVKLSLYYCRDPDGQRWRDLGRWGFRNRVSSWLNNQTRGTYSEFRDVDTLWSYLFGGRALSWQSYVGDWANDRADRVWVC